MLVSVGKKGQFSIFFAVILFLAACGKPKEEKEEDQDAQIPTAVVSQSSGGRPAPATPQVVLDLFKDTSTIVPSLLASGSTDCLGIDNAANFNDVVEPWPPGLKAFLAAEISKFPEFDLVTGSVAGFFLAKSSFLSAPDLPENGTIAGIMCSVGGEQRGYVFLNSKLYVNDRQAKGPLENYQSVKELVSPYVLSEHGDQALYTLVHEIFHAIDQAYFMENQDSTKISGRVAVFDMAWQGSGESIDDRADIYARRVSLSGHICSPKFFSLAPENPDELAAEYRKIVENTNFISPYSQSNPFEDFADTLATWYFKNVLDNGLVRTVFSDDLTAVPLANARQLYKFDTKEILRTSARHRSKVCAMVDLVFASQDCESQLSK